MMSKKEVFLGFFGILIVSVMSFFVQANSYTIGCTIGSSCAPQEVNLFNFYSINEGHIQFPLSSDYPNKVCCSIGNGNVDLANNCNFANNITIIRLSDLDNAHAQTPDNNDYNYPVCLSSSNKYVNFSCSYTKESCDTTEACIASISSFEAGLNSSTHVANCSGGDAAAYKYKICCSIGGNFSDATIINGTVYNSTANTKVKNAVVKFFDPKNLSKEILSATTNENGYYWINASNHSRQPYSQWNAQVKLQGFDMAAQENIKIMFDVTNTINFDLGEELGCQADCTLRNDKEKERKCRPECDGKNGCAFPSPAVKYNGKTIKDICTIDGYAGRDIVYDEADGENETVIKCCGAEPVKRKIERPILAKCPSNSPNKIEVPGKSFSYNGKIVTPVTVICETPKN